MPELEERQIRDYVLSQWFPGKLTDDQVEIVQKIGCRRVGAITYDLYDVWMSSGQRWWVITNHTNLYPQEDFKSIDQVFTYHLGLMQITNEQFKTEPDELQAKYVSKPWRQFMRAADAMAEAEEAEDYQAVGMRCREAILTLAREHQDAEWVRVLDNRPKADDGKDWLRIYADSLTTGRPRDYMRALADKTLALAHWQTHYNKSTEWDAQLVLDATAQLLNTFTLLRVRYEQGSAERCPECDSYQLMEDTSELIERDGHYGNYGMWLHDVCLSCGWESEKKFDQWSRERLQRLVDYHTEKWSPPQRSMEELEVPSDD